jgi:hypothetical protein
MSAYNFRKCKTVIFNLYKPTIIIYILETLIFHENERKFNYPSHTDTISNGCTSRLEEQNENNLGTFGFLHMDITFTTTKQNSSQVFEKWGVIHYIYMYIK